MLYAYSNNRESQYLGMIYLQIFILLLVTSR